MQFRITRHSDKLFWRAATTRVVFSLMTALLLRTKIDCAASILRKLGNVTLTPL